ncbi:hypothetical protein ACFQ07_23390, partial [Actinomadura adrarensis]
TDVLAAAHAAAGNLDEARRLQHHAEPIQPDYFFTLFTTFRAMTALALEDRTQAADLYEALLPHQDGPPAGLESLSLAMQPPAQTLADLSRLLGKDPSRHQTRATELTTLWTAEAS